MLFLKGNISSNSAKITMRLAAEYLGSQDVSSNSFLIEPLIIYTSVGFTIWVSVTE